MADDKMSAELERLLSEAFQFHEDHCDLRGVRVVSHLCRAVRAHITALQREADEARAEAEAAREERDEALQGPWPEWALKIEKLLRDRGLYDQWTDEYDLPNDLAEHIEGLEGMLGLDTECMRVALDGAQSEAARLREALEPFADYALVSVNEHGWINKAGNERISDWLGPSDFFRAFVAYRDTAALSPETSGIAKDAAT